VLRQRARRGWLRPYKLGRGELLEAGPWEQVRAEIEAAVTRALRF